MESLSISGLILVVLTSLACSSQARSHLPFVDLGYVRQQASAINNTGSYVNFSNIAYAEPPLGQLRFSAPKPPKSVRGIQNGGSLPISCPQAYPEWLSLALSGASSVPKLPGESEDCLYLDVHVPKKIFERRHGSKGAPVLVWIHGGGTVIGSKTSNGDPAGVIARGMEDTGSDGFVYVALNYRLGAFGWLGGDAFRAASGVAKAGLHDQRFALQWIQNHIRKFGGDRTRVTVIGESSGATSIGYQITATLEDPSKAPFNQAIVQSTAEIPLLPSADLDDQFTKFLNLLDVGSLQQAKNVDTDTLQAVNNATVHDAPTGRFVYGQTHDGSFVKGRVGQDLVAGGFNRNLNVMTAYNLDEGSLFTPSKVSNFRKYVEATVPGKLKKEIDHVVFDLYPPPGPQTPYSSTEERALLFTTELIVGCNANAFDRAFENRPFAYQFGVPPAFHTADTAYTFYNGPSDEVVNNTVAIAMQTYFANFAVHGNPNTGSSLPTMPHYGPASQMLNLTTEGFNVVKDPTANPRCAYWSQPGT